MFYNLNFSIHQITKKYNEKINIRPQIIHTNLNTQLLLLLKKIHYLYKKPFNIHLPPTTKKLLKNTNTHELKTTTTRLKTIISKYNNIIKSITEFKKPLFKKKLSKINIINLSLSLFKTI